MFQAALVLGLCCLLVQAAPDGDRTLSDIANTPFNRTSNGDKYQGIHTGGANTENQKPVGSSWRSLYDFFSGKKQSPVSTVTDDRITPPFEELCDPDMPYDARSYPATVWVSYTITKVLSDMAQLMAKPRLEKYFNGANDQNLTIDMTKPLRLQAPRPSSMWGPGLLEKRFVYSMYLPPDLHANPPKPTDTELTISTEPPTKYFALKFSGYTSSFISFLKLEDLKDSLNKGKEQFMREFYFVEEYYNTPTQFTDHHNDILLKFSPEVTKPKCAAKSSDQAFPDSREQTTKPTESMYCQLCHTTTYDARNYSRAMWVSTRVRTVSSNIGGMTAYPKLNAYFSGSNDQKLKIPRTLPVRISRSWPPSIYQPDFLINFTYSYYLPSKYYLQVPQPTDSDVFLTDEPEAIKFAWNFTGFTYDFLNKQMLSQLEAALIEAGEQYLSSKQFATNEIYFASQLTDRRNDVTVFMDPQAGRPKCEEAVFPSCVHRDKECPKYSVLKNITNNIEQRHLSGNLYAYIDTNTCNMSAAYDVGNMPLHRYFLGANSRNETIYRVPPVILIHKSTKNPPEGCSFTYNLVFYMPAEKHLNAPQPTEDGVKLHRIEAMNIFALKLDDSTTSDMWHQKAAEMQNVVNDRGYCYDEDFIAFASYDAPLRPRPHRREIWIPQEECQKPSQPEVPQYSIQGSGCPAGTECPIYKVVHTPSYYIKRVYNPSMWVCKATIDCCDIDAAFTSSITPLYEYYQTCYTIEPKSRPVISFMSMDDFLSTECNKMIDTCAFLPDVGRLPLVQLDEGMTLQEVPSEKNAWQTVYVARVDGTPSIDNIRTKMTALLQDLEDSSLGHSNQVFVARYTLPWDKDEPRVEVGVVAETSQN